MSVLISIDPGEHTGIVVAEGEELVLAVTDIAPYTFLENLLTSYLPNVPDIVCERGPERGHQPETTQAVERIVKAIAEQSHGWSVTWVRPSEWKGHPKAELPPFWIERLGDRHQRDAASIARWMIWKRVQARRSFDAPV